MSKENKTAVIIGCGSIGALKPEKYDNIKSDKTLTIANAISKVNGIKLIGVCDLDSTKADEAATKWNTIPYYNVSDTPQADIAFVCVDTKHHYKVVYDIKDRYKTIVLEKPAGINLEEANKISKLHDNIYVNYTRRFEMTHKTLKKLFENIKIYSCIVKYTRGLKRDGCHAIDLMRYFFGEFIDGKRLSTGFNDYDMNDLTASYFMQFERCDNVHFVPVDSLGFSIFEIEILSENGRHILSSNGAILETQGKTIDGTYGDYMSLNGQKYSSTTNLHNMLLDMVNSVIKDEKLCMVQDAIEVHKIIEVVK